MHTDNRIHYSKTISVYAISGLKKDCFDGLFHGDGAIAMLHNSKLLKGVFGAHT